MVWVVSLLTMAIRRHRLTLGSLKDWYSEFARNWQVGKTPASKQSLYPQSCGTRLPLKAFRREPAISGFGRLFTPTHRSSPDLVTSVGAGLQTSSDALHPAHGQLTRFRVLRMRLKFALFGLAFALAPANSALTSHIRQTRWLIMQKAHSHYASQSEAQLLFLERITFQVLFHPPFGVLFTFPSRYYSLLISVHVQAWMVVHPDSGRISRVRPYSGILYRVSMFRLRGSHPLWPPVPGSFAYTETIRY